MARAERIRARDAADILGVSQRTVYKMAKDGELDGHGAAFYVGCWTFDETKLRAYVRMKEEETCAKNGRPRQAATGAKTRSGLVLPSKVSKSGEAYRQAMSGLLRPATRN